MKPITSKTGMDIESLPVYSLSLEKVKQLKADRSA